MHAPLEELTAHEDARALVAHAASTFGGDQAVEPAIVALRTHIAALVDAEIDRSPPPRRVPEAAAETEAALRHLAGVLLHGPSTRARDLAAEGRAEEFAAALEALYGIHADRRPSRTPAKRQRVTTPTDGAAPVYVAHEFEPISTGTPAAARHDYGRRG